MSDKSAGEVLFAKSLAKMAENQTTNSTEQQAEHKTDSESEPVVSVPEHIKELRAKDDARKLHGAQGLYRDVPLEKLFEGLETGNDAQKAAAVREYREIFADLGLSSNEARRLVDLFKQLSENPPDDKAHAKMRQEALARLKEIHGSDAEAVLRLAQKLIARDERVRGLVDQVGLGSHPDVVEMIVRIARQEKLKGRL